MGEKEADDVSCGNQFAACRLLRGDAVFHVAQPLLHVEHGCAMDRRIIVALAAFVVAVVGSCYVNDLLTRSRRSVPTEPAAPRRFLPRVRVVAAPIKSTFADEVNADIASGRMRLRFLPTIAGEPGVSGKVVVVGEDEVGRLTYSALNANVPPDLQAHTIAEIGTVLLVRPRQRNVQITVIDLAREAVVGTNIIGTDPRAITAFVNGLTKQKRRPEIGRRSN